MHPARRSLLRNAEVVKVSIEARLAVQTERGSGSRRGVRPRDSLPRAVLVGAQPRLAMSL